jgi:hypothetical protein
MSATGLEVFDTTLQKTNNWLNEAMRLLGSGSRQKTYLAFRSTLCGTPGKTYRGRDRAREAVPAAGDPRALAPA